MTEHYISVKEAATCMRISERAVQLAAERNTIIYKYVDGIGKGGKQLRILLDSLPLEAQNRYNGTDQPAQPDDTYLYLTDKQRKRLDEKILAVTEYTTFKRQYHKRGVTREFLKRFSAEYPDIKINAGKLEDWVNKYAQNGIAGLVDRRGGYSKGCTSLTEEMQAVFKKYYLTDKKPSIHQCYNATRDYFAAKGIEVPSESSFKRYLYTLPKEVSELYRNGKKSFEDICIPSIFTDYYSPDLVSNAMWVGDHHLCDVLVKYNGKIVRPWLSAWMDIKSRYIVGYVLNVVDPNADIVLDSFAAAVKNCGVPDAVQIDNGKDYKVHDLFNIDNDYSLVSKLRTSVRTSNPYNAKAKPIERFFRTFESYNKMLSSYIGDRPENRPTSMNGTNIMIERENKAMDFEEFKQHVANIINVYHNTKHSGNGMDNNTPYEVYRNSFKKPMRTLDEAARRLLLRRTTRTAAITKQGVKFAELPNIRYYNSIDLLLYGIGKKVFARYETNDVTEVYIYSESGEFICTAQNDTLNAYGAGKEVSSKVIRENNNRKKALRNKVKSFYPDIEVPSIVEVVENRSAAFGTPDFSKIPKTDASEDFEKPNSSTEQVNKDEYTYPEKDYRLNLGNIGKTAI